ncbi:MAG: hypothetical protein DI604_29295 [Delftia acidovorans]|nr:hypothetical protein [Delftia sp.]PZP62140.1 MAG: hypothetical protein DI604_29295 [Delftia acidovorans]
MLRPLSGCAASPSLAAREGDDALGAGRPFLGVPGLDYASFSRTVPVDLICAEIGGMVIDSGYCA